MSRPYGGSDRGRTDAAVRTLFGDRRGLAVFLAAVVFLGACWRLGFFIADTKTIANLLANVADGRLAIVDTPYSLTAAGQPGIVEVDGQLYGRNYGEVYLAVPAVWILELVGAAFDLRLLLAGAWSLGIVALGRTSAGVLDRPRLADVGAVLGVASIAIALLARTPLAGFGDQFVVGPPETPTALVALQLTTVVVTGLAATLLYRLLSAVDSPQVGAAGGLALILATPVGFWGTLPKRHVFTAMLLLLACFWFAKSRRTDGRRSILARAGAYGAIGFLASIHPFEAAFMLAVLAPIDLATAGDAPARGHAAVAVVLLLGAGPMLATNVAIAGDPLASPRILDRGGGELPADLGDESAPPSDDGTGGAGDGATPTGGDNGQAGGGDTDGQAGDEADGGGGGTAVDGDTSGESDGGLPIADWLAAFVAAIAWIGGFLLETAADGVSTLLDPGRLYHTFVRSGWIPGVNYRVNTWEPIELALLEVLPVAGALVATPALVATRLQDRWSTPEAGSAEWTAVDVLVGAMAVVFLVAYLPLLPLHSMVTLRYVVPAMPLLLYLICRLPPVRRAIAGAARPLVTAYFATFAVCGVGYLVALPVLDPAVGEALQLHALVGLATAAVATVAIATWPAHRDERAVAVAVAIPAGATTLFLLAAALWHFQYGAYALDLARVLAEALPAIG